MSTSPGSGGSPTEAETTDDATVDPDASVDHESGDGQPGVAAGQPTPGPASVPAEVPAEVPVQVPVVATSEVADAEPARPPRRTRWWFATATFGAGVVVGILLVGLLSAGTPGFVSAARSEQNSPAPGVPSGSVQVAVEAQVNAACLRVINEAQDVYGALTGLDEAVDQVDFQQLDDIARRLQPIEPRLARDLSDCEVQVNSGSDPSSSGSSSPVVPRPSASPTG